MRPGPSASKDNRPLAFFGDVHGNLPALEAVLKDLDRDGIHRIHVAGDLVFGGEQPLEVWRLLESRKAVCVRGASDTALATLSPEALASRSEEDKARVAEFLDTRGKLGDLILERLRRLPLTQRIPLTDGREIVMVHGSPADPLTELSHDLDDDELRALLSDDPADIVVCASSHVPFVRNADETLIVNVGSVGASPEGRVAHYTLIAPAIEAPIIEQRWAEY